ncbi:MAG: hypothetical protein GY752_09665 [bacterium]|nr:hypothetical protein [bacterium]MCP4799882.1 hypothetical protein [bacterium]
MTFKTKLLVVALIPALFAIVGCGSDGDTHTPTVVDTAPPAIPLALNAEGLDSGVVVLNWDQNTTDADFDGFKIYRVVDTRMLELTFNPISDNFYTDERPVHDSKNEYRVTALDFTGNESEFARIELYVEPFDEPSLIPIEGKP